MGSANLIQVKAGEIRGLFEIGVPEEVMPVPGGRGTLGHAVSQHWRLHGGLVQGSSKDRHSRGNSTRVMGSASSGLREHLFF